MTVVSFPEAHLVVKMLRKFIHRKKDLYLIGQPGNCDDLGIHDKIIIQPPVHYHFIAGIEQSVKIIIDPYTILIKTVSRRMKPSGPL